MKIIFTHIPKTGGTAARDILFNKNFEKQKTKRYGGLSNAITHGCEWDFLHGHAPYGIHKFIPCWDEYKYFTFLRKPIYHCISYYKDSLRWSEIISKKSVYPSSETIKRANLAREKNILDFYKSNVNQNIQTKFLSGFLSRSLGNLICLNENIFGKLVLFLAKINIICNFEVFGITERMRESIQKVGDKMGWEHGEVKVVNQANTETGRDVDKMSDKKKEQIESFNSLDVDLYSYAIDQFENQT